MKRNEMNCGENKQKGTHRASQPANQPTNQPAALISIIFQRFLTLFVGVSVCVAVMRDRTHFNVVSLFLAISLIRLPV